MDESVNVSAEAKQDSWCERLYDRKAADLVLYGRALGLSHGEAEDVLQDTFVALLKIEKAPAQPEFYCIRAFRNRALNFRRGFLRRIAREFESVRWFEPGEEDDTPRQAAAVRCLKSLPADQREVIVLKIWHEHTFEEIGELLELSPHTAAGRYRYGMNKLRSAMRTNGQSYEQLERFGEPIALLDAASALPKG